jgi:hypothetical protein
MKNKDRKLNGIKGDIKTKQSATPDFTSPDKDSDKTSKDDDADETVKKIAPSKSKLQIDPDSTGGDTKADKTKPEHFPEKPQE